MSNPGRGRGRGKTPQGGANNNNSNKPPQQQQRRSQLSSEFPNIGSASAYFDDSATPSLPVNLGRVQSPFASAVVEPPKTGPQRSVWGTPAPWGKPTNAPTQTTQQQPAIVEPSASSAQIQSQKTHPKAQTRLTQVITPQIDIQAGASSSPVLDEPSGEVKKLTEQLSASSISSLDTPLEVKKTATNELENSPKSATVRVLNGEFPAKRERGNLGRIVKLRANHYKLVLKKPFTVYQYDVELIKKNVDAVSKAPEEKIIKNKRIMREMFKILSETLLGAKYKNKMIYNFSKNLYSLVELPFQKNIVYEIDIDGSKFILKLKTINQVTIDPAKPDDLVTIQVLDLIFTQNFNYSCTNLNRSFFTQNCDFMQLGFGLQLWKGAYASVRPSECGLTWNLDCANAAFLTSEDVLNLAMYHYDTNDISVLRNKILNDKDGYDKHSIGASFLNSYRGRDIKTSTGGFRKKINGIGPDSSYMFEWTKGTVTKKVSIKDYLKQNYNIDLKYPTLPCINLGRESYLPMELCKTELTHKKNLDERQTAMIIRETALRAPDRMAFIDKWAHTSGIDKDPILQEYNINVNLKMIEMDGRILDAPDILYNPNIMKSNQIASKGSWDHRNFKFANPRKVDRWVILNFSRANEQQVAQFADKLIQVGNIHGMAIQPYLFYRGMNRPRDEDVRRAFEEIFIKYKPLDLVVVVFSGTTTAYKVVKTAGDLTYGVSTQGVEDKNVQRISDQTVSNILLKINTKLGGRNFLLSPSNALFSRHLQDLYKGPLMLFGADVTHPTPDAKISESIAAVVGSLDKDCCFYAARLYAQRTPRGQAYEMIHDLDKMVLDLLKEHHNKNKMFPKRIVFFRDGVSEGQFSLVLRFEINKIRTACQQIHQGYKPAITFVIVQKRHHTRLFTADSRDSHGKAMNVQPGTIVDTTIVTKMMFDFFLCSHSGIQGTSRPCHYFVLHDDNEFTTNQMQLLSHYLCHIYSRCPRSVSYPAPAYYSHLAAFRGRDYIRKVPPANSSQITSYEIELHPDIKNKMFYN